MATIKSVSKLVVDGDWIESKDQSPEGIRLIQTGNIGVGEYLDKGNRAKFISEETLERLNCTELVAGDILISRLPDPVGRACKVPENVGRAITAVDCTIVRLNPELCNSGYFVQYTQSDLYQNRLSQFLAGSTRTRISRKNLEQIEVPLPSIIVQEEITSILGNVDEMISLRKQQLAKQDELVKARFVELFGNRGENPYNFPTTTMGNIYKFQYGKGNNIPEDKGEYPCYGSNGVVGHHTEYNSEDSPIIGHIGAYAGIVNWGKGKHYVTYNGVICKLINDQVNPVYGYYLLQLQDYNTVAKSGAAQPFVSYKDLDAPVVNVPPMEVQNQFAAFVEQTDKSKLDIQKSLDKLETLKKALMQKYFG